MHLRVALTCILVALFATTSPAQSAGSADQKDGHVVIRLVNGDVISGELASQSKDDLSIVSEVLGRIQIERRMISGIEPGAATVASPVTQALRQQNSVTSSSPQKVETPAVSSVSPDKLKIAKLKISTGLLLSTQRQESYSGELDLVKGWHSDQKGWMHQRSLLLLSPSYDDKTSLKGANITHNYNGILQHTIFTSSENLYVPVMLNFYSNNSLGIYLQQTYAAGVGKTMGALEVNADLRFIGEHFYAPAQPNPRAPSLGLVGTGLSERYDFSLSSLVPGAKLTETMEFVPVFNEKDAWQGHGIVELALPFTKQLSVVLSAFDNYVENAPATFRKNYFKTSIGLQYTPSTTKK